MLRRAPVALLALTGCLAGAAGAAAQARGVGPGARAALASDQREPVAPRLEAEAGEEAEEPVFGEEIELYDPTGQALRPLHDALRGAERGTDQARVVVYGASHVAADFFTNVLRERLQARFGDAGHGFIMPARPWRRYRHLGGIDVESNRHWEAFRVRASTREVDALGVAGLAVEADSRSAFGRIDTGERTASRFVLFYLKQPDGGSFDVKLDGRRVARIRTASDELEPGYREITAEDARHVLEVRPRGDGPVRLFGVSVEREQPGVLVDNMGINGARAVSHLLWNEALHTEYLRRMAPDLVVLAYGTNESGDDGHPIEEYEAELRRVVGRVRGTVPEAACMLIGPSDRPMRGDDGELVDRPRTHQIVEVQRRVSRDMGCSFFDLVAFGGGPLSMLRWAETDPPYAQRDHVHFTVRGYLRLGEVLHGAMMEGFDSVPRFDPPAAVVAGPRP
jgi:lysophospholipase L1-like esterase